MSGDPSAEGRLPKGVSLLARSRNGRGFLASVRRGKGVEVHLGIYESAELAGLAFNVASVAIGRGSRPLPEVGRSEQPDADQVRAITARVRRRLGLGPPIESTRFEAAPDPDALLTLFEVTVVGFWRAQGAQADAGPGLDSVGRRLAEAARLVFWSRSSGHPGPSDVLEQLLGRRLDQTFRRSGLTRMILDDDGDDDWRVARWLALPDVFPGGRGFRDEVRFLYPEAFEADPDEGSGLSHWASVLGLEPPITSGKVRDAYRIRSKSDHPDAGGSHSAFLRLQAAYDEAREYCRIQGV